MFELELDFPHIPRHGQHPKITVRQDAASVARAVRQTCPTAAGNGRAHAWVWHSR
jgi:hypothetical protein